MSQLSDREAGRVLHRTAVTSLIASSIEYYDFFVFGTAAALVFPTVFFPAGMSPLAALLSSFSTLAVGFFARPLGAAVIGNFGDRFGRKRMLVLALLLMSASTTLVGLLPSYAAIGDFAPLLLALLRFVQGFALGGQWGGAVLIILENAPPGRRGWYGSFAQAGAPIGTILANLAFLACAASMSPAELTAWGWRVPFLISVALIAVSLFIQLRIDETAAFRELQAAEARRRQARLQDLAVAQGVTSEAAAALLAAETQPLPALEALRRYPRQILVAAGTFVGLQAAYYVLVSFGLAYGSKPAGGGMPANTMLSAVLIGAFAMVPGVFLSAWLSDRVGRRGTVVAVSAILLAAWMFAVFPLIALGRLWPAAAAVGVGQFLNGMILGPLAALYAETFETRIRYSAMSLAYQLGTLIGGALAPIIATALFARYGSTVPVSAYVSAMCLISSACAAAMPRSRPEIGGVTETVVEAA